MIIHGFPGIGKSTLKENAGHPLAVNDLDSGLYRRGQSWPFNYLADIVRSDVEYDTTLVSTHEEIVELLPYSKLPLDIWCVIPGLDMKEEVLDRYANRGSGQDFIETVAVNFNGWVRELQRVADRTGKVIELRPGQFLSDVITEIPR